MDYTISTSSRRGKLSLHFSNYYSVSLRYTVICSTASCTANYELEFVVVITEYIFVKTRVQNVNKECEFVIKMYEGN